MNKRIRLITSPLFLFALLILVVNDFFLKHYFGNFITGKLSDFAGLFLFPLFICFLTGRKNALIFILTGLAFIFWKSAFSESFINWWNTSVAILPLERVVDYSDLSALLILPLAYLYAHAEIKSFSIHPVLPVMLSFFAIAATSYRMEEPWDETIVIHHSKRSLNEIFETMDSAWIAGPKFSQNKIDTVEIFITNDICSSGFTTILTAEELSGQETRVHLLESRYSCKKEEGYREQMIKRLHRLFDEINSRHSSD